MFVEVLKTIVYGIVEGITEWLPISSTGHLILLEEILPLNVSKEFFEFFMVVIQLGAILAVVTSFFGKLNPIGVRSKKKRKVILQTWVKILIACVPAGVLGILLDDWFDAHFYNPTVVAIVLIAYGVLFILLEMFYLKNRDFRVMKQSQLTYQDAIIIGAFQCLALIPGTSRSGSTILGAMILGVSRPIAAEFSFFLSIPVMVGASLVKLVKFGFAFSAAEIALTIVGMVVAFLISMLAIRFIMNYVRRHDFKVFGYYRIALGLLVLLYFALA